MSEDDYVSRVMLLCALRSDYPGYSEIDALVRRYFSFDWPVWSAVDRVFQFNQWPRPWRGE